MDRHQWFMEMSKILLRSTDTVCYTRMQPIFLHGKTQTARGSTTEMCVTIWWSQWRGQGNAMKTCMNDAHSCDEMRSGKQQLLLEKNNTEGNITHTDKHKSQWSYGNWNGIIAPTYIGFYISLLIQFAVMKYWRKGLKERHIQCSYILRLALKEKVHDNDSKC